MFNQDEAKKRVHDLYNGEYELVSEYTGTKNKITLKHTTCGHEYSRKANDFLNEGNGLCPVCHKPERHSTRRLKEEDIPEYLLSKIGDKYSYISDYKSLSDTNTLLRCNCCGNEFRNSISRVTSKRKRGCPKCANLRRGPNVKKTYLEDIKGNNDEYEWLDEYNGDNKEKLRILHKECNNTYKVRPNDFQQGWGRCPYCSTSSSEAEREISKYIANKYSGEVIRNYKQENMEIDVYLPELNLGFEYNGIYWHSDKFKDKNYHLNKKEYFKNKGIDVVFIDEADWINKKDLILSMIDNKLNLNKKIPARKTIFKAVSPKDEKEFLNENHLQGFVISSLRFGLYYEGKLVSLITFIKGRRNINDLSSMEILRFATLKGYTIQGGFSKLLKNSIKYINENFKDIDTIKTYADYSISNGNVYLKNGFELIRMSKPSYSYYKNNLKFNRYTYRKSELKKLFPDHYDESLTEFQIIDSLGSIKRVWNCGNLVLEYKINKPL